MIRGRRDGADAGTTAITLYRRLDTHGTGTHAIGAGRIAATMTPWSEIALLAFDIDGTLSFRKGAGGKTRQADCLVGAKSEYPFDLSAHDPSGYLRRMKIGQAPTFR